jgi:serine/threonine-protein kinase RsbW
MRASIKLCSERSELIRLETFVDEFARRCDLPPDERARLFIILEELLTNTVTHGSRIHSAKGNITVTLQRRSGWLAIDFLDDGQPFDPLALGAPDLDAAGEDRVAGGLGIHIIRSLVDRARYWRAGGRNHLRLFRRIEMLSEADG